MQPKGLKIDTNTAALKTSLQKHGFSLPFYGWRDAKSKIWIIDGHTRKSVLEELISEGIEVPELLPCTFIAAKDKKEAVKLLLEVYNQRQNQIDQFVIQVFVEEYDIPIEDVAVESLNVKEYDSGNNEQDYSNKNKEIDTDDFSDKMTLKLEYSEDEYNEVKAELSRRGITAEAALYNYLFGENE